VNPTEQALRQLISSLAIFIQKFNHRKNSSDFQPVNKKHTLSTPDYCFKKNLNPSKVKYKLVNVKKSITFAVRFFG